MVGEHYQIDGDQLPQELIQTGGAEEALTALRGLAKGVAEKNGGDDLRYTFRHLPMVAGGMPVVPADELQ